MRPFKKLTLSLLLASLTTITIGLVTWRAIAQDNNLPFDTLVRDSLEAGETDHWSFEAHRNDVIEISITPLNGKLIPQLALFDRSNTLQARLEGQTEGEETKLTLRLAQFSQYTLEVSGADESAGSYHLRLSLLEEGLRDFEQGELFYGQTVSQHISDTVPYHIWTFNGAAGQVIDLNMTTTRGNLRPVLTLTAPGGDIIANSDNNSDSKNARILAFRLPGSGVYTISARRSGANLGFSGETSGDYELELTLRNSVNATATTLIPDTTTRGRVTSESPLARYFVIKPGLYIANVELSDPYCLVDIALMNNGITLLERFVGVSPFEYPIAIPDIVQPILEISTANCPGRDRIDFSLSLTSVESDLPLRRLGDAQPIRSQGIGETERWFFHAQQGEMIRLSVNKEASEAETTLRVIAPDTTVVYSAAFYRKFEETLTLTQSGIYILQILPNQEPYTLEKHLVGSDGVPFTSQEPIWEHPLDIDTPQAWNFFVNTDRDATLLIEGIQGELIAVARSTLLGNLQLLSVSLPEAGRYRIKVISDAQPRSVTFRQDIGSPIAIGESTKGTLIRALEVNRWTLPLRQNTRFDLTLEVFTLGAPMPTVTILDQTGLEIRAESQLSEDNRVKLFGITAPEDALYTILVTKNARANRTDYRLSTSEQSPPSDDTLTLLRLSSPVPEGFQDNAPQRRQTQLTPSFTEQDLSRLERGEVLGLPVEVRAEIPADSLHQFWQLNIGRGQLLSVQVISLNGEPAPGITLFDAQKRIILERWEPLAPSQQILYRTPAASRYYLAITGSSSGQRYLLEARLRPGFDETVPTVHDWLPLAMSQETLGEFRNVGETDTFALWGNRGDMITIATRLQLGNLAPNLVLKSPSGSTIANLTFDPALDVNKSEPLRLPETGLYSLEVTSATPSSERQYSLYSVLVSLTAGRATSEGLIESENFGALGVGVSENTGFFYGTAGEHISLRVEPTSSNGPTPITLTLSDSRGKPFLQESTQLSLSSASLENVILPRTGIYQVSVAGGSHFGGSYRLTLTRDTRYLRTESRAITYGDTRRGVFTAADLVDRWLLNGNKGDVIAIALRPLHGDRVNLGFQLETPSGQILSIGTDTSSSGARVDNILLPDTDLYYVTVGAIDPAFAGSLSYQLSVEQQNQTSSRSIGTLAEYDVTYASTLFADDPSDIWLFEGTHGDIITISVTGDGVLQPIFSLIAYDAPVLENSPEPFLSRTGTAISPAQLIEFTLPDDGAYALRVEGIGGTTGSYTLKIAKIRDGAESAQLLRAGQTYQDSLQRGEQRLWQFDGNAGDSISLELKTPRRSSLIPHVKLTAPNGRTILVESRTDGDTLRIGSYRLPMTGAYILQIAPLTTAEGDSSEGSYTLTFQQARVESATASFGFLSYGEAGINAITADNPSDLWTFDGEAGDVVRIVGTRTSGDLDPLLKVTGPDGTQLAAVDDSGGNLNAETLIALPQTGRYTVEIAEARAYPGESESNYRLDIFLEYRSAATSPNEDRMLTYGDFLVETLDPLTTASDHLTSWYFVGQVGDQVDIQVQFPANEQPLRLFIGDGAGNHYLQGERIENRAVIRNFALPADGLYTIDIQRSASSGHTYYPYSLQLNLRSGDEAVAFTNGFLERNTTQGAAFSREDDTHAWFYNGTAGERLTLTLLKLTGERLPSVMVFTPDNRLLLNYAAAPETQVQRLPLVLPSDGFYQIVAINDQQAPFLSYRIALNSDQTQTIVGNLITNVPDWGTLDETTTEHIWLVEGKAGSSLYARALVSSGNLKIALRLETPEGAILVSGQDEPVSGQVVLASPPLPADGEYRLVIAKVGGQPAATAGSYQVRTSLEDSIPEALTATLLEGGQPIASAVTNHQPAYFGFLGATNVPVSISTSVTDGSGTPTLRILSAQGEEITTFQGELETLYLPENGYYLIEVLHPTPISFLITYLPRPNSDSDAVTPIIRAVNLPGRVSLSDPVKLWAIEATTGETLLITVDDFSRPVRNDLVLFDPDGIPTASVIEPVGETDVTLGPIFIAKTGVYTLRVGAWLGQASSNGTQYVVRVRDVTDEGVLGSEGGAIAVLGQPVRGGLAESDPADEWTFTGIAGGLYDFELRNRLGGAPLHMTLKAPDGQQIDLENYVTRNDNLTLLAQSVPLGQNGLFTVTVSLERPSGTEVNAYSLRVSRQAAALQDILITAQSLTIGEQVSGEVTEVAPAQAWVFFAKTGTIISADAETAKGAGLLLTLTAPDGTPLKAGVNGIIEPTLLLADGFYGIVISTPSRHSLSYTLNVQPDELRTSWRETLHPSAAQRATLTPGVPLHEWTLAGYNTGEYQITVKPTRPSWQAKTFLMGNDHQVIAVGEPQPDGATILKARLSSEEAAAYTMLVTSEGASGAYDILFDLSQNVLTPALLTAGIPVTGRITPLNTADEWLWNSQSANSMITLTAARTDGDFAMTIRLYAPGNLFLQQFDPDENGEIHAENILLPVEGTYIIQVTRKDDITSPTQGSYDLQLDEIAVP